MGLKVPYSQIWKLRMTPLFCHQAIQVVMYEYSTEPSLKMEKFNWRGASQSLVCWISTTKALVSCLVA